jgi:hypothetical protein
MKVCHLTEARGLFARQAGEQFYNQELNQSATLLSIDTYPDQGRFDSAESMQDQIEELEQELGQIEWVNTSTGNQAFAIAKFELDDGTPMHWGRYFRDITSSMLGKWPSKAYPVGWRSGLATAVKAKRGLQPTDLIGTDGLLTAKQAINLVSQNAPPEDRDRLIEALNSIQQGRLPVFENMAEDAAAVRDYFGEIMAPLALINRLVGGQAEEAQSLLLGDQKWSDCQISWPQDESNPLIDSALHAPNGEVVGISSKGGSGASSSIVNVYQAIDQARKNQPKLIKQFSSAVDIIETIKNNSAIDAPLILAQKLGIISENTRRRVPQLIDMNIQKPEGQFTKKELELITKRKFKFDHPSFNGGAALLASIAAEVTSLINQDPLFARAIKAFMNQSSTVQINLFTSVRGKDVHVTRIEAIYPPNFQGQFLIQHEKNYTATEKPRGKLTLKIK